MSSDLALDVQALSKRYRLGTGRSRQRGEAQTVQALDEVSFSVAPGEAVGVIGGNGAGKSTLLKVLSRITRPDSGRAVIAGRVGSLLEVGTGFHPELTGRENVFINGAILGMRRREIARHFDEIVEFAEIARFLDTPVKRYSSGMYVRLAFAVAAHLDTDLLLVDEVLAVGDAEFQRKCLGKMNEVTGAGRTILFVSHNHVAVEALCPRCVFLQHGRVAVDGPTAVALSAYLSHAGDVVTGGAPGTFPIDTDAVAGSGLHVERVRLESRARGPADVFLLGEAVSFALDAVGLDLQRMVLGLRIRTELGTPVTSFSTDMPRLSDREAGPAAGVEFRFDSLPLTPGVYELGFEVDVRRSGEHLLRMDRVARFTVAPTDIYGNGFEFSPAEGPLLPVVKWRALP